MKKEGDAHLTVYRGKEGGRRRPELQNGRLDETWRGQNVCFNSQLVPDWAVQVAGGGGFPFVNH